MDKYSGLLHPISTCIPSGVPQHWADLGCGTGVFTRILAQYLPESSKITAIDKVLQHFPETMGNSINIDFRVGDFENESLPLQHLDGIMMANSLHYVRDKEAFILQAEKYFAKNPAFLIIEYNRTEANQWVPYPIPFEQLKTLFSRLDYTHIEKIGEQKSLYGGVMYACYVRKEVD